MSFEDLDKFLKAVESVKDGYTCGVCSELCQEPVTLSNCLHIICGAHFDGLKNCPTCNTSLEGCSTYTTESLEKAVQSAKELDKIFESYRTSKHTKPIEPAKQKMTETNVATTSSKTKNPETPSRKVLRDKTPSKSDHNKSNINTSLLSSASKFDKGIERRNSKGETLLHISCRLGKVDRITELLNQGANTNTKDNAGWTPLHEVVQNGRLDLVTLLLQYNTLINVPGQSNETPLHEAIRYKHTNIAVELVKNGADLHARNCKGETPYQLASSEVKNILLLAADNIIQTQTVNISRMSALYSEIDFDNIRVYCVSRFRTIHGKLKSLTKTHSNLHLEAKFTKNVTHLIVDAENGICQSTLDVLQGVVSSIWILTSDWVMKSNEDKLEQFDAYEVIGIGTKTYQGAKNSRYNKYKQLPGVFNGCHFYLHNFITKYEISKSIIITKAILSKLITDAGGIVLRRAPNPELIPEQEKLVPYHAKKDGKLYYCSHYIIFKDMYEPMYNMQHLKALPIGWLIECIEKYELCEPW